MFSDEFWKAITQLKGPQLGIFAFAVVVVLVIVLVRILAIPGATKAAQAEKKEERDAAQEEENRRDTIVVMQAQIQDLQDQVRELKRDLAQRSEREERDREYRHALANQAQALAITVNSDHELLHLIAEEWPEMPKHFRTRIAGLKTAREIINDYPLPAPLSPVSNPVAAAESTPTST